LPFESTKIFDFVAVKPRQIFVTIKNFVEPTANAEDGLILIINSAIKLWIFASNSLLIYTISHNAWPFNTLKDTSKNAILGIGQLA